MLVAPYDQNLPHSWTLEFGGGLISLVGSCRILLDVFDEVMTHNGWRMYCVYISIVEFFFFFALGLEAIKAYDEMKFYKALSYFFPQL